MNDDSPAGDEHHADDPADGVASSAAEAARSVEPLEQAPPGSPRKRTSRPKPAKRTPAEEVSDAAAAEAAEDVAQAEGSTGEPVSQEAVDAVVEAPASFGAPAADTVPAGDTAPDGDEVPSANGTNQAQPAVLPPETVAPKTPAPETPAPETPALAAADPRRFAPVAAVVAALVGILVWRRRR